MNEEYTSNVEEQVNKVLSKKERVTDNKNVDVNYTGDGNIIINQYDIHEYESKIDSLKKDRDDAREVIKEMKSAIESLSNTLEIITKNLYSKDDIVQAKDELIETLREEIREKDKMIRECEGNKLN